MRGAPIVQLMSRVDKDVVPGFKNNGGRECRACRAERSRVRYLNQRSAA